MTRRLIACCLVPFVAACAAAETPPAAGPSAIASAPTTPTTPPPATSTPATEPPITPPSTDDCPTDLGNGMTLVFDTAVPEFGGAGATPLDQSAPGATCVGMVIGLPEPELDPMTAIDTTAPPGYVPTTTPPPPIIDTGTVPQLLDSPDVVQVDLAYAGSVISARFGPTTSGGVKLETLIDGAPSSGGGAPDAAAMEGFGNPPVFLPDGAVAFAYVGAAVPTVGATGNGAAVEVLADGVTVETVATGVGEFAGGRVIVLFVVPPGTRHVEVTGATDGDPIAFDLPGG